MQSSQELNTQPPDYESKKLTIAPSCPIHSLQSFSWWSISLDFHTNNSFEEVLRIKRRKLISICLLPNTTYTICTESNSDTVNCIKSTFQNGTSNQNNSTILYTRLHKILNKLHDTASQDQSVRTSPFQSNKVWTIFRQSWTQLTHCVTVQCKTKQHAPTAELKALPLPSSVLPNVL